MGCLPAPACTVHACSVLLLVWQCCQTCPRGGTYPAAPVQKHHSSQLELDPAMSRCLTAAQNAVIVQLFTLVYYSRGGEGRRKLSREMHVHTPQLLAAATGGCCTCTAICKLACMLSLVAGTYLHISFMKCTSDYEHHVVNHVAVCAKIQELCKCLISLQVAVYFIKLRNTAYSRTF